MKQAKIPLYIRFGEIPDGGISYVHLGDYKARPEGGLSVWKAVEANGRYYPDPPEDGHTVRIGAVTEVHFYQRTEMVAIDINVNGDKS